MSDRSPEKATIALTAEQGRHYALGDKLSARFLADEAETGARYSISEWRLEPGQEGVGAHRHAENDDVFYVLEGRIEFLLGETWTAYGPGAFIRAPAGVTHDFRNRGAAPARLLNIYIPGGFERDMQGIVAWFAAQKSK